MSRPPTVAPFRGVRYDLGKVKDLYRVTAPPYDVISPELQKRLYARDPHNVVRLILGAEFQTDSEGENRYTRAAADWNVWLKEGILIRDPEPSIYLYEQEFEVPGKGRLARRGLIALRRLEEFVEGKVRPHEKTLAGPKADRLLLMKACGANFSPIFSLYSDPGRHLPVLLNPFFGERPLAQMTDDEAVRHRLWRVSDPLSLRRADEILREKRLTIADGHHRYETAIAYRDWMRERTKSPPEEAPFNYVMMFFAEISDPGLVVLPTHRILQNQPGFDPDAFKKNLRLLFEFKTFPRDQRLKFLSALEERGRSAPVFGLLVAGDPALHLIALKGSRGKMTLDTMVLHEKVLKESRDTRFVQGLGEAMAAQGEPGVNAVFLLNPPKTGDLQEAFESGKVLPPKSTYFYPKLLTGLVMNSLGGQVFC